MTMPANVETSDPKLLALLALAAQNMRLLPIYPIRMGRCGCGKAVCHSPGKHPLASLVQRGVKQASWDDKQIAAWHHQEPDANWAVATGARLLVLDVDRKHGVDGHASIQRLEAELGTLPHTLRVETPTGGYHLYFECVHDVSNIVGALGEGVDVRSEGGYVVCPPSVTTHGAYRFEDDLPIEAIPESWVEAIRAASKSKKRRTHAHAADDGRPNAVIEGGRNDYLFAVACRIRNSGLGYEAICAAVLAENATRCEPPLDEAEVKAIAESASRYEPGPAPSVEPTADPPPEASQAQAGRSDDWHALIEVTKAGAKSTISNITTILSNDPEWEGVIGFDQFLEAPVFLKAPPFSLDYGGGRTGGEIEDADDARIATWLGRRWKLHTGIQNLSSALLTVAKNRPFHPVRAWLDDLKWDGVERLETWLTTYMGADDTAENRNIGKWLLISAIARVRRPGAQVDTVTIFEGKQGRGKSSALRVLFQPWFTDELPNFRDAQAVGQNLRGVWCVELAELAALLGQGNEVVNRAITQRSDRYRPSYGRRVREFPRQCIFTGSTNRDDYLTDRTGARRWHPVFVRTIRLDELERDRSQLFAEALAHFEGGAKWWPEGEAQTASFAEKAAEREAGDPWMSLLAEWVQTPHVEARVDGRQYSRGWGYVTSAEILSGALKLEAGKWGQKETQRLGDCMRALGWHRRQIRDGAVRFWVYQAPEVSRACGE